MIDIATPAINNDPVEVRVVDEEELEKRMWRSHEMLLDWIEKADQKASFVLALATVVSAFLAFRLDDVAPDSVAMETAAAGGGTTLPNVSLFLLGIAIILSALVVSPRLALAARKQSTPNDLIYFGHLVGRPKCELGGAFRNARFDEALSNQISQLSKIAWRKHLYVIAATWLAIAGIILVLISVLF